MCLDYINQMYRLNVKKGQRVEYTGNPSKPVQYGTVVGSRNSSLKIRLDGEKYAGLFHPTWCLRYLETGEGER